MNCKWCGKVLTNKQVRRGAKYCCRKCCSEDSKQINYKKFLNDEIPYGQQNMHRYKKHFLKEQDFKCAICGISNIWNNKELVFVLDHINGNSDDNSRTNLRLVCPNCDSQLDTFKSKNKHSARAKYRNKNMERINGNINNEEDDNVEPLTDNADGNDVGMETAANE